MKLGDPLPPPLAVLVDLGNVLIRFDHMTTCTRLATACALAPQEIHRRLFGSGLEQDYDLGRISERDFALAAGEALETDQISPDEFLAAWAKIFTREEANIALLAPLARQVRLILLSNTNPSHFQEALRLVPELHHCHAQVLSFEEGHRKPQPEIFQTALKQAGVNAHQACFVDDGVEHVNAATKLGMDAILHRPGTSMRAALLERGLELPSGD
jgi:putative hydrolase of the HAD superfamily